MLSTSNKRKTDLNLDELQIYPADMFIFLLQNTHINYTIS